MWLSILSLIKFDQVAVIGLLGIFSLRLVASFLLMLSECQVYVFLPVVVLGHRPLEVLVLLDKTSCIFLITVTIISIAVFTFRWSYIAREKFYTRFRVLLLSFVASIMVLILCPNLFTILLGWDGLGVSSYLLVIYYNREKSYNAGIVTAITNRLGDIIVIIAIGLISSQGHWNRVMNEIEFRCNKLLQVIIIVGCFTKSAQIPFRAWLPAAIAAPTPVSSLVHSSTLVTAGVYVLIRHTEHVHSFQILDYALYTGTLTMLIARASALAETDIKKIVALSTLRQLGIMVTSIGISWILMAFMHLIIHAYFKAIIFISTGNAIHVSNRYQSCSKTGFLLISTPLNSSSLITGALRLVGAPFAAAFFSKEPILEGLLSGRDYSIIRYCFMLRGVALTALYSMRFMVSVVGGLRKLEPSAVITEDDNIVDTRVQILFIPSFTRGVLISSFYCWFRKKVTYYPELWIPLPLLLVVLGAGLAFILRDRGATAPGFQYSLIIWSMPFFSSSVTHKINAWWRTTVHYTNFMYLLSCTSFIIRSARNRPIVFIMENNLLYRLVIFLPLVIISAVIILL